MIKTILAPNAWWYTVTEDEWNNLNVTKKTVYVPAKPEKRTYRAKPADIDKKFEEWLSTIERIKK